MSPRSALDVLVDLNDKVASGNVAEYQAVLLGFTALDKTIGTGLRAGELLLIGGAQGTGKTTMALQMARNVGLGRAGQRPVPLLRARRAIPAQPPDRDGIRAGAPSPQETGAIKIQDVRKEILGSWVAEGQTGPTSRATRACGRRSTGSPATARTCSCCAARRRPARSTTSASSSASIVSCPATGGCS